MNLRGELEIAFSQISYPSLYQNVTEGKFTFADVRKGSEEKRKIVPKHIEPGFYPNFVYIVVAMNNKIRERLCAQAFENTGIYLSVDQITKKIDVHLPEDQPVYRFQSYDLSHNFGCDFEQNR